MFAELLKRGRSAVIKVQIIIILKATVLFWNEKYS